MSDESRHKIDIVETGRRIGILVDVIRLLCDQCPDGHTITKIHEVNHGMAVIELEDRLEINDHVYVNYALLSLSGYLFPVEPEDADYIPEVLAEIEDDT